MFTAKQIVYWCACRYLNEEQIHALRNDLSKSDRQGRRFVVTIEKFIDLERLRSHPIHPLDILVYNYLLYDFKGRLTRGKLLSRYEREVIKANSSQKLQ